MTTAVLDHSALSTARRRNARIKNWSFNLFLALAVAIWIIPLVWMVSLSLSDNDALQRDTTSLLPVEPTLDNFTTLFDSGTTTTWLWNSVVVTVSTTVLTLILASMAGYAFARVPFRGKKIIFPVVLAGLMVPKEAMFIPLFLIFADFDQHNTYHALVLPRIAAPLGVFIMTQFFSAIPSEIEEAAVIDGASRWKIFWKIMLPMSVPALTALGIFTFVLTWNDFLWPLVSATDPDMFTITTGLASRQGNFAQANALGDLMAQGVFASLPLLILFFIFQRQIIRGISLGSGGK
ncbi:MAG: carbohydrate ABC transporter permease [Ilumatobacteraceae bacterium]|jgi:multiple sugar transport system permease protein